MNINKDMTIGEVIREFPKSIDILMSFGMGCVGCPSAQAETIGEAAQVHGLNVEELIDALNSGI